MLTCLRGGPERPEVEVVWASVRFDSEKQGHFALALRLRDAPRGPMEISAIRYKLRVGPRLFTSGMTILDLHLAPGQRDLPVLSLPFALEDPVTWPSHVSIGATGSVETGAGTDYWLGFEGRVGAEVTQPPRDW